VYDKVGGSCDVYSSIQAFWLQHGNIPSLNCPVIDGDVVYLLVVVSPKVAL